MTFGDNDASPAAIAAKSLKETSYHLHHSRDWLVRLGDGTEESHARAQAAVGPLGAILVTAIIFAAAHISSWGLARPVSLLPLALALGWLRWRTGRLWPGIALHGWSNLALVTYLLWPG